MLPAGKRNSPKMQGGVRQASLIRSNVGVQASAAPHAWPDRIPPPRKRLKAEHQQPPPPRFLPNQGRYRPITAAGARQGIFVPPGPRRKRKLATKAQTCFKMRHAHSQPDRQGRRRGGQSCRPQGPACSPQTSHVCSPMTLSTYSKQARQARSRMPRLSSAAAYVQMDQLMGKKGTSPSQNASGPPSSNGRRPAKKSSR